MNKISENSNIYSVGIIDHDIRQFEGQYYVPYGMNYNSYVIMDDKIAVMDSVDKAWGSLWLANVEEVLQGRKPDYLVVQHMEPDHSANIKLFAERYPEAVIVASAKALQMMKQFHGTDFAGRNMAVGEGSTLSLGAHTLTFVTAPMVHWPEVIVTYESSEKVLFSADAFGRFGTSDADIPWADEARRYYIGIVGKYGMQVQNLLKKAAGLDIKTICPLHGPVLGSNLGYYIGLVNTWSSYEPEEDGVLIACASIYGNTLKACEMLAEKLKARGKKVRLMDLTKEDKAEAISEAFRYSELVVASVTYNLEIFPAAKSFIDGLSSRLYKNRKVGLIENGTWAPMAGKLMRQAFEGMKNITICENTVLVKSAPDADTDAALDKLADEL